MRLKKPQFCGVLNGTLWAKIFGLIFALLRHFFGIAFLLSWAGELSWDIQGWLQAILLKIYLHGTYVIQARSLIRFYQITNITARLI